MYGLRSIRAVLVLSTFAAFPHPALASGDPVNGKVLYDANCQSCHFEPPDFVALRAANNVAALRMAINKYPEMGDRPNIVALTVDQLTDITAFLGTFVSAINYQGLWWDPAESGWGINFAHQGDQIFATWYTYDTSGNAYWLSMLAARTPPTGNAYTGTIYVDSGPPFNNFVGMGVPSAVGNGTLTFSDVDHGSFAYTVNTTMPPTTQTKAITRFDLGTGPQPTCIYSSTTPNFTLATNYQDLWWVPNGAESGWGVNFAHQGDSIFATWYTYNVLGGTPLWLSALAARQGTSNVYVGAIYQNSGPRFDVYDTTKVVTNPVGTATFTFADGNDATFQYKVMIAPLPGPITQSKQLTRFPFAATGGTVCQ